MYYYRKVRKLGLLEMTIILFFIFTIGHFLVIWAAYLEKKFEMVCVIFFYQDLNYKTQRDKQLSYSVF